MKTEYLKSYYADFQEREFPEILPRDTTLPESKKIRVVIGARRVGKTYSLYSTMKDLMKSGVLKSQIVYLNFEHPYLREMSAAEYKTLFEILWQQYPETLNKKLYLFIDEPQVLRDWELVVRSIQDEFHYPIYLTGSSSQLLSAEIATSLRGRSIKQTLYPLSFKEFLRFKSFSLQGKHPTTKEKAVLARFLDEYLRYGGYPEVVLEDSPVEKLKILREYLELTVYKDIAERYHLRNMRLMKRTIDQLTAQATKEVSLHKVFQDLKSQGLKVSKNTVYGHYRMLEESLYIHSIKRYDDSIRKEENSTPKAYLNDTGFMTLYNPNDYGKKLENVVALELKRRAEEDPLLRINYYRAGNGSSECDFVLRRGNNVTGAIQVCYSLNDENEEREMRGLTSALTRFKLKSGMIITFDREESSTLDKMKINTVPAWKWLLSL
jgi:hypothetical protein